MIGRGSRSFGKCTGHFYMVSPFDLTKAQITDGLISKDNRAYPQGAAQILQCAIKVWFNVDSEKGSLKMAKSAILDTVGGQKWKMNWTDIKAPVKQGYPNARELLSSVQFANTDVQIK